MTLTEMLSKESAKLSNLGGSNFKSSGSGTDLQPFQRQGCSLSVKKINRPASVPSTKKFEDGGVSVKKHVYL